MPFGATRSLEHFWSGILDPVGFLYSDAIARYWTVVERNSQLFSWSTHAASGVFLYNRLLWGSVGLLSLVASVIQVMASKTAMNAPNSLTPVLSLTQVTFLPSAMTTTSSLMILVAAAKSISLSKSSYHAVETPYGNQSLHTQLRLDYLSHHGQHF